MFTTESLPYNTGRKQVKWVWLEKYLATCLKQIQILQGSIFASNWNDYNPGKFS